ncbi:MAG: ATP synthase F0 subunit B [Myxococcales bacterium]|nr:ATP synthase F0 subunit B [Myxococcales bacterium]
MEGHSGTLTQVFYSLEFWALVLNFILLLAIFWRMGRKPLIAFLETRRALIQSSLQEAARIKADAEAKHAEYTKRLGDLDHALASLRAEMIQAGELERDRIVADAEGKAARMRQETQFLIEQRLKQLRIDLIQETVEAAISKAASVLAESTAAEQQKSAQHYLDQLSKIQPEGQEN